MSEAKENRYDPYFFTSLKQGEFVGTTAHSNYEEFRLRFKQYQAGQEHDLPTKRMVLDSDVEANYKEIIEVVTNVIK